MYRYETVLFHDVLTKNTKPYSVRKELISDVGAMISHPVRTREKEKGRLNVDFNMPRPLLLLGARKIQTNKEIHKHANKEIRKDLIQCG